MYDLVGKELGYCYGSLLHTRVVEQYDLPIRTQPQGVVLKHFLDFRGVLLLVRKNLCDLVFLSLSFRRFPYRISDKVYIASLFV